VTDVLFFADIEITGGTGVFFFRLLEYLCCKHHVRLILEQKHLKNTDIRKKIENLCKVPIIPYIKAFRMEHFIYRVFRKLHLEIPYLYYRDLILLHRIQKKYKTQIVIGSHGYLRTAAQEAFYDQPENYGTETSGLTCPVDVGVNYRF